MPSDPHQRIEEWLRAYAEQRREQAGAPFELHPATRRMLQGEAARVRVRQAQTKRRRFWSGPLFWPRLSLAFSAAVLASVLAWIWIESNRQHRGLEQLAYQGQLAKQMAETTPRTTPPQPAEPAKLPARAPASSATPKSEPAGNAITATTPLIVRKSDELAPSRRSRAGGPEMALATTSNLATKAADVKLALRQTTPPEPAVGDKLASNLPAPAASSPASASVTSDMFASSHRAANVAKTGYGGRSIGEHPAQVATKGRPPAEDLIRLHEEAQRSLFEEQKAAAGAALEPSLAARFYYQRLGETDALVSRDRANSKPGLLSAFELEQTNGQLRLLDADGSVYVGSLITGSLPALDSSQLLRFRAGAVTNTATDQAEAFTPPTARDQPATGAEVPINFRVAGTNHSLNQFVVINGSLSTLLPAEGFTTTTVDSLAATKPASAKTSGVPVVTAAPLLLKSATRPAPATTAPSPEVGGRNWRQELASQSTVLPDHFRATAIVGGTNQIRIEAIRVRR